MVAKEPRILKGRQRRILNAPNVLLSAERKMKMELLSPLADFAAIDEKLFNLSGLVRMSRALPAHRGSR